MQMAEDRELKLIAWFRHYAPFKSFDSGSGVAPHGVAFVIEAPDYKRCSGGSNRRVVAQPLVSIETDPTTPAQAPLATQAPRKMFWLIYC